MAPPPEAPRPSIDEVLAALDAVVARARAAGSPLGYFAVMYRNVTAKVRDGIAEGFFDDGERMARLDVAFASRYLDALRAFEAGERPTRSWQLAFRAAASARPIVLQHLLLGVNAHINLDLGIATAATAPGAALPALRRDFDRINEVLAVAFEHVQRAVATISPLLGLLDRMGGRTDDEVIRFSIDRARAGAWAFARELAPLDREAWSGPVGARDAVVARVARMVLDPGMPLGAGLLAVRACEGTNVRRHLDVLAGAPEPSLSTVEARVRDERAPVREV